MDRRIDQAEVRKVAKLARLDLNDHEVEEFTSQLGTILDYVDKMRSLNLEGVEPLAHCLAISNCLREDAVSASLDPEQALANAPDRDDNFFRVPKILDESGGA